MVVRAASFDELTTSEFHDLVKLRLDVFVVEQECAYPELDGRDTEPGTRHLWIAMRGELVATLRILDDGDARRIGRVATGKNYRKKGHAANLMRYALTLAKSPFVLDAQSHLAPWYEQFGFVQTGHEFLEDGIPHIPMRRE